jgi:dephospho-CoA kinase
MMKVVIGLTGGIGSGKSTVSGMLAQLGAVILNADEVGHETLKPGTEAWQEITSAFGQEIVKDSGEIDRGKLGEIVFSNPKALARLNSIMHPRMYQAMKRRIEEWQRQGAEVIVLEAAILVEANWTPLVDEVWVTTAPEATVVRRLRDSKGLTETQVLARIRSQLPHQERAKHADIIIENACELEGVKARVKDLWRALHARQQASV